MATLAECALPNGIETNHQTMKDSNSSNCSTTSNNNGEAKDKKYIRHDQKLIEQVVKECETKKLKEVADKFGIKYGTVVTWKRKYLQQGNPIVIKANGAGTPKVQVKGKKEGKGKKSEKVEKGKIGKVGKVVDKSPDKSKSPNKSPVEIDSESESSVSSVSGSYSMSTLVNEEKSEESLKEQSNILDSDPSSKSSMPSEDQITPEPKELKELPAPKPQKLPKLPKALKHPKTALSSKIPKPIKTPKSTVEAKVPKTNGIKIIGQKRASPEGKELRMVGKNKERKISSTQSASGSVSGVEGEGEGNSMHPIQINFNLHFGATADHVKKIKKVISQITKTMQ